MVTYDKIRSETIRYVYVAHNLQSRYQLSYNIVWRFDLLAAAVTLLPYAGPG